jgi:hypothetical protein
MPRVQVVIEVGEMYRMRRHELSHKLESLYGVVKGVIFV